MLDVGGAEPMQILCNTVVNAAGHGAPLVSRAIEGIPAQTIPQNFFSIGHYYTLTGKTPFNHLVYPVARHDWLGVHVTIDLGGRCKFGPDFSWRDSLDYRFDESREARFYEAIRRYYPGLKDGALQPGYTGMRPRITGKDQAAVDFVIQDHTVHGVTRHGQSLRHRIAGPHVVACHRRLRGRADRQRRAMTTRSCIVPLHIGCGMTNVRRSAAVSTNGFELLRRLVQANHIRETCDENERRIDTKPA